MSNHDSAYDTETLLINWSNGIRTLVVAPTWNVKRIKAKIIERLPEWKKDRDEGIKNYDPDCEYICGIVWNLESLLNYDYGLAMLFLYPEDVFSHPTEVLDIGEPYDIGETESINEVTYIYPKYVYPYHRLLIPKEE